MKFVIAGKKIVNSAKNDRSLDKLDCFIADY